MEFDTMKYFVREVELYLGAELDGLSNSGREFDEGLMEGAGIVMNALWKAMHRESELAKGANTGMAERYARASARLSKQYNISEE